MSIDLQHLFLIEKLWIYVECCVYHSSERCHQHLSTSILSKIFYPITWRLKVNKDGVPSLGTGTWQTLFQLCRYLYHPFPLHSPTISLSAQGPALLARAGHCKNKDPDDLFQPGCTLCLRLAWSDRNSRAANSAVCYIFHLPMMILESCSLLTY